MSEEKLRYRILSRGHGLKMFLWTRGVGKGYHLTNINLCSGDILEFHSVEMTRDEQAGEFQPWARVFLVERGGESVFPIPGHIEMRVLQNQHPTWPEAVRKISEEK